MYAAIPAFLQPSTFLHALRANLTTEPKVLFVYALLLVVPWVVWQGLRTGDADPMEKGGGEGERTRPPRPRKSRKKPEVRSRKTGRDRINWIQ